MMIKKVLGPEHLEEVVNDALGLVGTKGSGSLHGDGDGKGKADGGQSYVHILSECKHTEKTTGTISVKKKDFEKTSLAALRLGRLPAMFKADGDGEVYCVIKLEDFADIFKNHLEYVKIIT